VRIRGGGVGLRRDGTWATHAVVPDEALAEVPEGTDLALAAGFFSPCVTAHAAVRELGAVQAGERVAVVGAAGAVGAVAVQLALDAGAEVVGVERDASRLAAIPAGATPVAIATDRQSGGGPLTGGQAAVAAVLGATGGERVDVLIDTAGGPALPALVTGAVAPGGRAVLVGYAAGTEATFVLPALLAADVRLIPMNLIRWEQRLRGVAAELLERLGRGELELARTVLPLERVGEAVASLRAGTAVGRVVVTNEGSR
jgi:NADPH:quinone reductase-like Zn-dependent oxidoreductase